MTNCISSRRISSYALDDFLFYSKRLYYVSPDTNLTERFLNYYKFFLLLDYYSNKDSLKLNDILAYDKFRKPTIWKAVIRPKPCNGVASPCVATRNKENQLLPLQLKNSRFYNDLHSNRI